MTKEKKPKKMKIITDATGKALEYAPLELNIYKGCTHACDYCYAPQTIHKEKEVYFSDPDPKKDVLKKLESDCIQMTSEGDTREILLSFIGDVYQPEEMNLGLTREVIKILIKYNQHFTILTKGGTRACRDFDLLENYPHCRFGTTLVFYTQDRIAEVEPGAATVDDRIEAIKEAHRRGIKTWISLEPVIDTDHAHILIILLHPYVDHWKVGELNYQKARSRPGELYHTAGYDRADLRDSIIETLDSVGADYYIKESVLQAA